MRRASTWAVLGALVGLGWAVTAFLPAQWLQAWVSQASHQQVQWVNTSGSIWQGQTQLRLTGGEGATDAQTLPGIWAWRVQPAWRDGPALDVQLQAQCCLNRPLQLQVAWAGHQAFQWQVSDVQLSLPLRVLQGLGTPWNTLQLEGNMKLKTQNLHATSSKNIQGQVTLDAQRVASRLSTVTPLGDYQATLTWPQNRLPQIQLRTLNGHLQLQGQGQIAQGRVRFRGQATASAESEGALANLLNIIGRRSGSVSALTIG